MVPLDIDPEDEKEGIIQSQPQIPKLKKPIETKKIVIPIFTVLIIFIGIAILIFGLNLVQKSRIKSYDSKIKAVNDELSTMQDTKDKAEAVYGQVQNLENLWASRTMWSNLMREISSTMIAGNKIDAMSIEENGKLHIKGISNSLYSLAKLISSFENNSKFSNVKLVSSNVTGNVVNYDIEMGFSADILQAK